MSRLFSKVMLLLISGIPLLCCSSSDNNEDAGNTIVIDNDSNIRLVIENQPELDPFRSSITQLVTEANSAIQQLMPIDHVTIRVASNPQGSIPEIGIGGFNPNANEVLISIDSGFNNLEASLEAELPAMIAHEMNHAKRRRSVGYGNTLSQALISEGLADHFSVEVTGISPPRWSVAVQGQELQDLIGTASQTWNESSYGHPKWFFGTTNEVPRWAGYSMGYKLVNDYLENHPNTQPSDLVDEPAESFLP